MVFGDPRHGFTSFEFRVPELKKNRFRLNRVWGVIISRSHTRLMNIFHPLLTWLQKYGGWWSETWSTNCDHFLDFTTLWLNVVRESFLVVPCGEFYGQESWTPTKSVCLQLSESFDPRKVPPVSIRFEAGSRFWETWSHFEDLGPWYSESACSK
jgi:hypothetical protein